MHILFQHIHVSDQLQISLSHIVKTGSVQQIINLCDYTISGHCISKVNIKDCMHKN